MNSSHHRDKIYRLIVASTAVASLAMGLRPAAAAAIDRRALVGRHAPHLRSLDPSSPLSVGNGQFAFTVDVTGLQSLGDLYYARGIPTETLARWVWHEEPNPHGYTLADANVDYPSPWGSQAYPTRDDTPAAQWLRRNPHSLPLARVALDLVEGAPRALRPEDISAIDQVLDMWTGVIHSSYRLAGTAVDVRTAAHPSRDALAVQIDSRLVRAGRLRVRLDLPRGHRLDVKNTPPLDWSEPERHQTRVVSRTARQLVLERTIDATRFRVGVDLAADTHFAHVDEARHEVILTGSARGRLAFTVTFWPQPTEEPLPSVEETFMANRVHWPRFWTHGAAVDLAGSTDARADELERRVVLSQYLTAIQSVASIPPQETGLTCNTWYGKHHTEMVWWHTAHFALWGRPELLAKNLEWYLERLPRARQIAAERGLAGARWPKMVGPEGRESPGGNPLIIWNQPHPIHLCELLYRGSPTPETLARYGPLVFETAQAMASMLHLDEPRGRYVLGPPLWIAQEIYDRAKSQNPSFELEYWVYGLSTAQRWRERMGQGRLAEWDDMIRRISPLPVKDGLYVALESHPDTFDNLDSRHDHPTMLAPLGLLPGTLADRDTMRRTLRAVLDHWDFEAKIWGWDYPMIAMTAARLGDTDTAVDILLRDAPNNHYLPNGHCPQRSDMVRRGAPSDGPIRNEIATYLPANGALLAAVAMMAGGWDGAPSDHAAPGFPNDGRWKVRAEGLQPLP